MKSSAFAALAAVLTLGIASAAVAQTPAAADRTWGAGPTDYMSAPLNNAALQWSPMQVRQALEAQGYTVIDIPVLAGTEYIVRARKNGVDQTFRVDSYTGGVVMASPQINEATLRQTLEAQGFEVLSGPVLNGTKYTVRARKQGVTQEFRIDANTGAVEVVG